MNSIHPSTDCTAPYEYWRHTNPFFEIIQKQSKQLLARPNSKHMRLVFMYLIYCIVPELSQRDDPARGPEPKRK